MATSISFVFPRFLLSCFLLSLSLLCSLKEGYAFEERESNEESYLTHTIQLSSLSSSSICDHFTKANERKSTVKVVDKYGPCFNPNQEKPKFPSHTDILHLDWLRVNSIHTRLSRKSGRHRDMIELDSASIPTKDGSLFGIHNFVVTVGLGTPKKDLSLVLDTGSDLAWTQCDPCQTCFKQNEVRFDRKTSTTYVNVTSTSALCKYVERPDKVPQNAGTTCVYGIEYDDGASSAGFFAQETLTLSSSDKITNFLFGCGVDQQGPKGTFGQEAGILGLNRESASIIKQTSSKYNQIFSYCLPSSASKTGHLTFGKHALPTNVKYTALSARFPDDYGVDLVGLGLGGVKLNIPESVFTKSGTIVDSGSSVTYLPSGAYKVLQTEFEKKMSAYPKATPPKGLDTCYNLTNYDTTTVPQLSFIFKDGTEVSIPKTGILFKISASSSTYCLPFIGNDDDDDEAIIGNIVQKTMEVVYDIPGKRIGLAPNGCM